MKRVLWAQMRRGEIAEARDKDAVVVLPVGSIEQHGAHLPVGTDSLRVDAIAVRAAEMIDEFPVLVAPLFNYGISPYHMVFPGTITLSVETLCRAVQEICRCIWQHGFRHILILNGHGGNSGSLENAVIQLSAENIIVGWGKASQASREDLQDIFKGEIKRIVHAGEGETSEILYLHPESVDMSLAVKDQSLRMPRDCAHDLGVWFSFAWISGPDDTGLYGDPTLASAETGKKLLEIQAGKVAKFIRAFKAAPVPENWRKGVPSVPVPSK